jgi:hypothetical protein
MIIREARVKDIKNIKRIADILQVSRNQPNWQKANTGFFEYLKTEQDFFSALNPHFIVAETTEGIRGYCLSYNDTFLRELHKSSPSLDMKFILKNCGENFLYGDQIGILNPNSLGSSRIANELIDQTINLGEIASLDKIVAYVSQFPFFNSRSDNFLRKKGFIKFGEAQIENGIILGAYEFKLK